jgi:hypothetical protein
MRSKHANVCLLIVSFVAIAFSSLRLQAGQTMTAPDPMTSLLTEVHALRIALEQSATVTPRVQLTLARLNIEEQRIAQLAAQLDQVRRELSVALLESQKLSDLLPELSAESRLEQQLRTRENDAAQALTTEQARWMDLNSRLDELERLLAPIPHR